MNKYVKRIACSLITAIMFLTFVGCGINNQEDVNPNNKEDVSANSQEKVSTNNLEDIIVGTWDAQSFGEFVFKDDGTCAINSSDEDNSATYRIDGNKVLLYEDDGELAYTITGEVKTDDILKMVFEEDEDIVAVFFERQDSNKVEVSTKNLEDVIAGTWDAQGVGEFVFKDDGIWTMNSKDEDGSGTYRFEENKVLLYKDNGELAYTITGEVKTDDLIKILIDGKTPYVYLEKVE